LRRALNLELAKKAPSCLEFIVVHELMHLRERRHTDRFYQLMDRYLPDWRTRRSELYDVPLAHERWLPKR
jgi:predicted metal-dependent hydrolase